MSKIDDFKLFVSKHPEFIDYVKEHKSVSWQTLYELYDMYGESDSIWNKYLKEEVSSIGSIKGLLNTLKNINIDSLEENISSIQKAVSLVEELTRSESKEEITPKEEKIDKLYKE